MVKVLRLNQFCGQEVFSSDSEPVAVACSDLWLFLATAKRIVEVRTLRDPKEARSSFQTIATVLQLAYNAKADCLVTVEKQTSRKGGVKTARVYFHWDVASPAQPARIRLAGTLKQGHVTTSRSRNQVEVVELRVTESATSVSCCPRTGNVAVAGKALVHVFVLRGVGVAGNEFEFEPYADIRLGSSSSSCRKVALCHQFVASVSKDEIAVIKLNLCQRDDSRAAQDQRLFRESSQGEESIICDFSSVTARDHSLAPLSSSPPTLALPQIDLAQSSSQNETVSGPRQVFGPVDRIANYPITVDLVKNVVDDYVALYASEDSRESILERVKGREPIECTSTVILYEKYAAKDTGGSLHSLQFVPTYRVSKSKGVSMSSQFHPLQFPLLPDDSSRVELVGLSCFVSGPRQGFMYDVKGETDLISVYPYTHHAVAASVGSHFVQVATLSGLESYTLRSFAKAAQNQREIARDVSPSMGLDELFYQICPPADVSICLIGMHPFIGLCKVANAGDCVVLVSKAPEAEKSRPDLWSRSISKLLQRPRSADCTEWGVYILKGATVSSVYTEMSEMSLSLPEASGNLSVRHQLLCEANILLRMELNESHVQRHVIEYEERRRDGELSKQKERQKQRWRPPSLRLLLTKEEEEDLLEKLKESVIAMGDMCCIPGSACSEHAKMYYNLAGLCLQDVVQRAVKRLQDIENDDQVPEKMIGYGEGLSCYLMEPLFSQSPFPNLDEKMADTILEIVAEGDYSRLSDVIMDSRMKTYSTERAVQLLYDSFRGDHPVSRSEIALNSVTLAVLHLRQCEVDLAQKVLKSLVLLDLYCVCVLKPHYLIDFSDKQLTPLGQLLCKHETDVFMSVIVYFVDENVVSLKDCLKLLGVSSEDELHDKKYARNFLEAILCSSEKEEHLPVAMESLARIYVQWLHYHLELVVSSSSSPKLTSLEFKKVPSASSCFGERPTWLDDLGPLAGSGASTADFVPRVHHVGKAPSKEKHYRPRSAQAVSDLLDLHAGRKRESPALKANISDKYQELVNLQALLCSPLSSESLARIVLSEISRQSNWQSLDVSLRLLCLPLTGFKLPAVDLIIRNYPKVLLSYCLFIRLDKDQWQHVLGNLLRLCGEKDSRDFVYSYKACLEYLAGHLQVRDFLTLLPASGRLEFFFPFLKRNCTVAIANSLKTSITASMRKD